MSYQTQYSNPNSNSNSKVNLDIDNEDEFEEFEKDNWSSMNSFEPDLWDENWDDANMVDEDLSNYLNVKPSS